MTLSKTNRRALMLALHQSIEDSAVYDAERIYQGINNTHLDYPPNGGLTSDELNALNHLRGNATLTSALRKVLATNAASALFEFFNLVDGTTDPDESFGDFTGIMLVDKREDGGSELFLHDEFFETYWDWRNTSRK